MSSPFLLSFVHFIFILLVNSFIVSS
jgi:hypothetical protein